MAVDADVDGGPGGGAASAAAPSSSPGPDVPPRRRGRRRPLALGGRAASGSVASAPARSSAALLAASVAAAATLGALLLARSGPSLPLPSWSIDERDDGNDDVLSLARRILRSSRRHKPLLPLDATDRWGFSLATLGLMIAAGGGIGGGGVLVPIYILVMNFSPKRAIPLSNVTVFGGAVANTLLNFAKRHPLADRPLVDWDLILVMEPLTIAGALGGAFLNKLLPEAILAGSLVALLSVTGYTTLKKAIRMYQAESRALRGGRGAPREREDGSKESELTRMAREMEEDEEEGEDEKEVEALLDAVGRHEGDNPGDMDEGAAEDEDGGENDDDDDDNNDNDNNDEEAPISKQQPSPSSSSSSSSTFSTAADLKRQEELAQILEEERTVPMGNVQVLAITFVIVLLVNLLKGGGAFPSPLGIRCGSPSFWVANGLMLGWILVVSYFARGYLVRRHEIKERCGYPYVDGDIKWDARATIVYPVVCTAAGFFAGMFGVGGGIVKGPLMLAMGVHPRVSSASSATMILFTSFTATTSFAVFGLLDEEYAGMCLALGFAATFAGQVGLFYLMRKFRRNSYIAFSIGGIVALSAMLMTIQSLLSMADAGGPRPPSGLCAGGGGR
ncbi:hypothetical protein ACHAWF_010832 [Thalassiosira exigua]